VDPVRFLGRVFLVVVRPERRFYVWGVCPDVLVKECISTLALIFGYSLSIFHAALFVFTTKEAAEKFVAEDPYVSNGIVTDHSILEWTVVVGNN
jgi:hypothetical protein